jgi:hypothetical protein
VSECECFSFLVDSRLAASDAGVQTFTMPFVSLTNTHLLCVRSASKRAQYLCAWPYLFKPFAITMRKTKAKTEIEIQCVLRKVSILQLGYMMHKLYSYNFCKNENRIIVRIMKIYCQLNSHFFFHSNSHILEKNKLQLVFIDNTSGNLFFMRIWMARCRWSILNISLPPFGYYILQGNGTNPQRKGDAKCIYQITNDDVQSLGLKLGLRMWWEARDRLPPRRFVLLILNLISISPLVILCYMQLYSRTNSYKNNKVKKKICIVAKEVNM